MERVRAAARSWPTAEWLLWFDRRFGLYLVTLAAIVGLKWRGAYDLRDYLRAAGDVAAGHATYGYVLAEGADAWGRLDIYISPPFLAHALAPLSGLATDVVFWVWTALGLASVAIALRLIDRSTLAARAPRLVFGLVYVWASVFLGQVNLFVLAGLLLALGARSDRVSGFGLALATVLRLVPLAFGLVLLLDRRWRALGWTALFVGLAILVSDPSDWIVFAGVMTRISTAAPVDLFPQAALAGFAPLVRPVAAVSAVIAVLLAWRRPEERPLAVAVSIGLSIVLLPLNSWVHWYSFAIVGLLLWGDRALWSRRAVVAFVAAAFVLNGWVSSVIAVATLAALVVHLARNRPWMTLPADLRPAERTADILAGP